VVILIPLWIAFAVLAVGALLKSWNLGASIGWALSHGGKYAERVEAQLPATRDERLDIIRQEGGAFRPLGAKSCRLYSLGAEHPALDKALEISFRNTLLFAGWVAALVIGSDMFAETPKSFEVATACISFWLVIYSLSLLAESIMWYALAKDYALVWGSIKFSTPVLGPNRRGKIFGDVLGLLALLVFAIVSLATGIANVQKNFGGYSDLPEGSGWITHLKRLIDSTYYVLANMTTVGDPAIAPESTLARAQVGLLMIMVILFAGFILAALAARLGVDAGP
jgi:hypothetical protein